MCIHTAAVIRSGIIKTKQSGHLVELTQLLQHLGISQLANTEGKVEQGMMH